MGITESILLPELSTDAARPLITYYDESEGTRVELSVATTANWAAKTANWLVEEVDVEPGEPVAMLLPPHWQTLGVLFGAWWCGAAVTDATEGARCAFVRPGAEAPGAVVTAEVSLHPMGLGLPDGASAGAVDFVEDSRVRGDDFLPLESAEEDTVALGDRTVGEVLEQAREGAARLGIEQGTRVLSTADWAVPDGVLDVLAVFAGGGSLVQCVGADAELLARRAETERTTVRLGC